MEENDKNRKPKYARCNCGSVPEPHWRQIRVKGRELAPPGKDPALWGVVIDNRKVIA